MTREEREQSEFAQLLFALKDDGSVAFTEHQGYERPPTDFGLTGWHASNVTNISVTSQGRIAAGASGPHIAINQLAIGGDISNIDLTVFIDAIDRQIDQH
jgi:hypothetical protein